MSNTDYELIAELRTVLTKQRCSPVVIGNYGAYLPVPATCPAQHRARHENGQAARWLDCRRGSCRMAAQWTLCHHPRNADRLAAWQAIGGPGPPRLRNRPHRRRCRRCARHCGATPCRDGEGGLCVHHRSKPDGNGKNGEIRAICRSLSRNKSPMTVSSMETVNHISRPINRS